MIDHKEISYHYYDSILAGIPFQYGFRYPDTVRFIERDLKETRIDPEKALVQVSGQAFADWERTGGRADSYAEYCLSCVPVSEMLLPNHCCIFHAAAVRYRNGAYLIAAGSGVGKSTQCRTLTEYWPREISVINGDKPVLACRQDGSIWVYPSPWNGKEGWHGAEAAPLAGLFLLRRGERNSLKNLRPSQAAAGTFLSIFQSYEKESVIRQAGDLCGRILQSVPVWLLTSLDVPDSTIMLYEAIRRMNNEG